MSETTTGMVRMMEGSKREVPSDLSDGNMHMQMGLVKREMRMKTSMDRKACTKSRTCGRARVFVRCMSVCFAQKCQAKQRGLYDADFAVCVFSARGQARG